MSSQKKLYVNCNRCQQNYRLFISKVYEKEPMKIIFYMYTGYIFDIGTNIPDTVFMFTKLLDIFFIEERTSCLPICLLEEGHKLLITVCLLIRFSEQLVH